MTISAGSLFEDPLVPGIVEGPQRRLHRVLDPSNINFPATRVKPGLADEAITTPTRSSFDQGKPHRPSEGMPVGPRPYVPHSHPIAEQHFAVVQQGGGVRDEDLDDTLRQSLVRLEERLLLQHGVYADETAGLVEIRREAEPRFQEGVRVVEVVPVVSVPLLEAQAGEGFQTHVRHPTGGRDFVVNMDSLFRRDEKFESELPHVSNTGAGNPRVSNGYFSRCSEGKSLIADVIIRQLLKHLP
mmetsp:Transcript_31543/g.42719  ORF Transcript_31543/g.42719 Transcript_31543/m.42719 type:complete len:242 (-) Transcript_31543:462-1187(-)